ncbi:putative isoprenoid synthase domain-containing protein-like [Apostichopus japonicus]|uniref:Putative isoprenoid synthase domain-containing protein-like n=1 Tax=Stichopus japonicus TaxID=307972 RepID=A0A2G8KED4_STIJA|nr:putative isoprenoid synthase domain-containing protein-like [Apostichopus japonicus]
MACITRPVVAVLPAAGKGERFKSATPKQFSLINGQPLILYTLKSLQRIKWVQKIYVAISESWFNFVENLISQNKLSKVELVQGGDTRHESIKKCVFAIHAKTELDASEDDQMKGSPIVIVHDAVRPFVDEETYSNVAKAAEKYQV